MAFADVARMLAPDLAKQNYFPARDAAGADLVIVVNWGSTLTDPSQDPNDTERQFQFSSQMSDIQDYNSSFAAHQGPDPAPITSDMTLTRNDEFSAQVAASYNARLLGYTGRLEPGDRPLLGLPGRPERHGGELSRRPEPGTLLRRDCRV